MTEVLELRKEASTMALYVAICLLAALAALPESATHTGVTPIIWGSPSGSRSRTGSPSASRRAWWGRAG